MTFDPKLTDRDIPGNGGELRKAVDEVGLDGCDHHDVARLRLATIGAGRKALGVRATGLRVQPAFDLAPPVAGVTAYAHVPRPGAQVRPLMERRDGHAEVVGNLLAGG
jgi:hypothetical protein